MNSFWRYLLEVAPALLLGFVISGVVHEFIPDSWVEKHLGGRGMKGVLWSTLVGTVVPVCCWGCLPIAVSFRRKGASLGPILAILIVTPATSINALLVTAQLLGFKFAIYLFFTVILMGLLAGFIGNRIAFGRGEGSLRPEGCACKEKEECHCSKEKKKNPSARCLSILKYAFVEMPREVGKEALYGLALAAAVDSVMPVGYLIKNYLKGWAGYAFALVFGLATFFCATMGVPVVDALIRQGLSRGAGFVLLLAGPITSYGTIFVLRKEFGWKVLALYLSLVSVLSLLAGYAFSLS
ncbi:MAG: permease [Candidatus Omnitrophica bacterium]|nr:permease [Candidatus Omnitrophota bacterium]